MGLQGQQDSAADGARAQGTAQAHTSGPWEVGGDGHDSIWVTPPNKAESVICDIVPRDHRRPPTAEDEANAHLIAAAPLLLEAVRSLIADLEHREPDGWMSGNVHSTAYEIAQVALAAAEGRQ